MAAVAESLYLAVLLVRVFMFVSADQTITAEPGQNVTLTCRAPNNNILVTNWSRADLGSEYVLVYRDGDFVPDEQHPSFKNRVDLQDRQMKDGDVTLILKNVTINDEGTYECRVAWKEPTQQRPILTLISIFTLSVAPPPGPTGGTTEDGGKKDGRKEDGRKENGRKENGGSVGLIVCLSLFVVVVVGGFVIYCLFHLVSVLLLIVNVGNM